MGKLLEFFYKTMGAGTQVSDNTSFVYEDGQLIPVDEASMVETKIEERRQFSKRVLAEDEYWMNLPASIQEREYPLFQTIRVYIIDKIIDYLNLKAEEAPSGYTTSISKETVYKDLAKDMISSQVLDRLISGRKLLPTAPPKSYFHYWYELVDDGEGVCIDVVMTNTKKYKNGVEEEGLTIRIDGEEWKLLKEVEIVDSSNEFILQWKDTDYFYRLSRMTGEDFERLLHPYQRKLVTKDHYSWKLTRIEKGDIE